MVRATATTRTRELTNTEAAVLALLAIEGEASGYDLLKRVRRSIAHLWAPARSQLYALLPRLVGDGLARSRAVSQSARPDKTVYRITAAGREALRSWHETIEPGNADTFMLKLFVGGLTTDEVLVEHVEAFRRDTEAYLEELRAIEPTNTRAGNDFYHHLLLRYGIQLSELRLEWADWALRRLKAHRE